MPEITRFLIIGIIEDKSGFNHHSETTISGIVSIKEKILKFTNVIVDKLRGNLEIGNAGGYVPVLIYRVFQKWTL